MRRPEGAGVVALITGPVRAGKSERAALLAAATGKHVLFVATAAVDPGDQEMTDRVTRHRAGRPREWGLVETARPGSRPLVDIITTAPSGSCLLVDSLGTWLAWLLLGREAEAERDPIGVLRSVEAAALPLAGAVAASAADVILIAEETGWGIVPPSATGRIFRDALGRLVRRLSVAADRTELVVAGHVVDLHVIGRPVDVV